MILSDREIAAALDRKLIRIDPEPAPELWTSTAIDLTLHRTLLEWILKPPASGLPASEVRPAQPNFNIRALLDDPNYATKIEIDSEHGFILEPGKFLLGYTREIIQFPHHSRIAARVEGKSSLARLGVGVHVTAPTIHAGFGFNPHQPAEENLGSPIQLEIHNVGKLNVRLEVGMPICQLILEEVRETPVKGYSGRFQDQRAFASNPPPKKS